MDKAQEIGDRIRQRRTDLGISQQKLAALADVDTSTVARAEQGRQVPRHDRIERIATALSMEPEQLVYGETGPAAAVQPGPDDKPPDGDFFWQWAETPEAKAATEGEVDELRRIAAVLAPAGMSRSVEMWSRMLFAIRADDNVPEDR